MTLRFLRCFVLCAGVLIAAGATAAERTANGVFLVATPALRDPHFRETVVLVTQPPGAGPFGVIINRPLDRRVADAIPELKWKRPADLLHYGGPVAREAILFLVRSREPPGHALPILKDVYITGDRDVVERVLGNAGAERALRAYAGYAGWAPGQLQNELSRGSWYVVPADAQTIFDAPPEKIWHELSRRAALRRTGVTSSAIARHDAHERGAPRCG